MTTVVVADSPPELSVVSVSTSPILASPAARACAINKFPAAASRNARARRAPMPRLGGNSMTSSTMPASYSRRTSPKLLNSPRASRFWPRTTALNRRTPSRLHVRTLNSARLAADAQDGNSRMRRSVANFGDGLIASPPARSRRTLPRTSAVPLSKPTSPHRTASPSPVATMKRVGGREDHARSIAHRTEPLVKASQRMTPGMVTGRDSRVRRP